MKLAPIALFVYNRPVHTRKTVEALLKNKLAKQSILYIFSDAPKRKEDETKVKEVRKYIHSIRGFKKIHITERKKNLGLANSIISGVTEVVKKHGKTIVLEDDLITSPNFLIYMNYLLNLYENERKIFSITGYNHPRSLMRIPKDYPFDVYFNPRACSWSWATWRDRWNKADWEVKDFNAFLKNKELQKAFNYSGDDKSDMLIRQMQGKIDSWAIRWDYTHFKNKAYCVYPIVSYVDNIGNDASGVHCGKSTRFNQSDLKGLENPRLPQFVKVDLQIMERFRKVYKKNILKKVLFNLVKDTYLYKYYRKLRYKK